MSETEHCQVFKLSCKILAVDGTGILRESHTRYKFYNQRLNVNLKFCNDLQLGRPSTIPKIPVMMKNNLKKRTPTLNHRDRNQVWQIEIR
jgi:hypothetical protein